MTALDAAFDNSYSRLPSGFFAAVKPSQVANPQFLAFNVDLAAELGLPGSAWAGPAGAQVLGGNVVPQSAQPLAMAYAGFQFGNWVPQLGDGRAILLGELVDRAGVRRDVQLKGAGPTPFSRGGDGRAALGPVLREYVVSEAMAALGVPTTRALAAVSTGEFVARETHLPGAVLTRVARCHVRVGTFQFFASREDTNALRALADYVIARLHPELAESTTPYLDLFKNTLEAQAQLIAHWQGLGFIHGVMNTDNVSVSGETLDYGPCAFMDTFDPNKVFSSIDRLGRYAYKNQPKMGRWNLTGLGQALLPILEGEHDEVVDEANALLEGFESRCSHLQQLTWQRKLGLGEVREGDASLASDLLQRMAENRVDFSLLFRSLPGALEGATNMDAAARILFDEPEAFEGWAVQWRRRLASEGRPTPEVGEQLNSANPAYIPRNHLVEEVIVAAVENADLAPFNALNQVLQKPFETRAGLERYAAAPTPDQVVRATFCGT